MKKAPSEESIRSVMFNTGAIWDAIRSMRDAYSIDTGDVLPFPIPAWDDLTHVEQTAFGLMSDAGLDHINKVQKHIAHLRAHGDHTPESGAPS